MTSQSDQGVRTARATSHEEWAHISSQHFVPLEPAPLRTRADAFRAGIETVPCSDLRISTLQASRVRVKRQERHGGESTGDFVLAGFQRSGVAMVRQSDRTAVIKAGEFTIFDTSRPYEIEAPEEFSQVVVSFPRERILAHVPKFNRLTAVTLDASRSSNALLLAMVNQLAKDRPAGSALEQEAIASAVESALVATLHALAAGDADVSRTEQIRTLILTYVSRNLRDPALNVGRIVTDLHLSESTVYRAFKDSGASLPDYIWQKRLEGICQELRSGGTATRSIGQIASSWGYGDSSLFSRKFKASTGLSPRQYVDAFRAGPGSAYGPGQPSAR